MAPSIQASRSTSSSPACMPPSRTSASTTRAWRPAGSVNPGALQLVRAARGGRLDVAVPTPSAWTRASVRRPARPARHRQKSQRSKRGPEDAGSRHAPRSPSRTARGPPPPSPSRPATTSDRRGTDELRRRRRPPSERRRSPRGGTRAAGRASRRRRQPRARPVGTRATSAMTPRGPGGRAERPEPAELVVLERQRDDGVADEPEQRERRRHEKAVRRSRRCGPASAERCRPAAARGRSGRGRREWSTPSSSATVWTTNPGSSTTRSSTSPRRRTEVLVRGRHGSADPARGRARRARVVPPQAAVVRLEPEARVEGVPEAVRVCTYPAPCGGGPSSPVALLLQRVQRERLDDEVRATRRGRPSAAGWRHPARGPATRPRATAQHRQPRRGCAGPRTRWRRRRSRAATPARGAPAYADRGAHRGA